MDKKRMLNDKKTDIDIHQVPKDFKIQEIHKNYGLWIIRTHSGATDPDSFYTPRFRKFSFYSISHMYDGEGKLQLTDNDITDVHAGDCVVITRGTVNWYGGSGKKKYIEDSVNFDGPIADMLARSGILTDGVYPCGKVRKLRTIIEYFSDPAVDSQIKANIELQKFAVELYLNKMHISNSAHPMLDDLLSEIREHPEKWWSVEEMAEMCSLSTDQLRRIFLKRTGTTPKNYVDQLKINHATQLLSDGVLSISDISSKLGYKDRFHFSRRFKELTGMSPGVFRSSFDIDKN